MNSYVQKVINDVKERNPNEPEFIQAVEELLTSISPVIDQHPEYEKYRAKAEKALRSVL